MDGSPPRKRARHDDKEERKEEREHPTSSGSVPMDQDDPALPVVREQHDIIKDDIGLAVLGFLSPEELARIRHTSKDVRAMAEDATPHALKRRAEKNEAQVARTKETWPETKACSDAADCDRHGFALPQRADGTCPRDFARRCGVGRTCCAVSAQDHNVVLDDVDTARVAHLLNINARGVLPHDPRIAALRTLLSRATGEEMTFDSDINGVRRMLDTIHDLVRTIGNNTTPAEIVLQSFVDLKMLARLLVEFGRGLMIAYWFVVAFVKTTAVNPRTALDGLHKAIHAFLPVDTNTEETNAENRNKRTGTVVFLTRMFQYAAIERLPLGQHLHAAWDAVLRPRDTPTVPQATLAALDDATNHLITHCNNEFFEGFAVPKRPDGTCVPPLEEWGKDDACCAYDYEEVEDPTQEPLRVAIANDQLTLVELGLLLNNGYPADHVSALPSILRLITRSTFINPMPPIEHLIKVMHASFERWGQDYESFAHLVFSSFVDPTTLSRLFDWIDRKSSWTQFGTVIPVLFWWLQAHLDVRSKTVSAADALFDIVDTGHSVARYKTLANIISTAARNDLPRAHEMLRVWRLVVANLPQNTRRT